MLKLLEIFSIFLFLTSNIRLKNWCWKPNLLKFRDTNDVDNIYESLNNFKIIEKLKAYESLQTF